MNLTSMRRSSLLALTTVGALAATGGTALAYWTTSGSGAGTASTSTMTFQVTALAASDATTAQGQQSSTLIPGGTASAILRVQNPNSYAVKVTAISAGSVVAPSGCTGLTFTPPSTYSDPQFTLAANTSPLLTLAGAVSMGTSAPQACMGASFSFPVTVTVQK